MKTNKVILLAIASGITLTATESFATESGSTHYISGEFNDFSTTVPTQPGWVFGNFVLIYNNGTAGGSREFPFGDQIAANVTANIAAEVPVVLYAYPVDFFGGTLASGIAVPFVWETIKVEHTFDRNTDAQIGGTKEQSTSGLGDIQMLPVMAGWTNGDFKFNCVLSVWAPTGDYNKDNLANAGLGYWTFTPMAGVSWLSSKFGTEASVISGVDFNTKNTDTDYQSGNIFHIDGTVAQHFPLFGGFAGAGASAFWMRQISNDSNNYGPIVKHELGGFMINSYGVGPVISYVHKIGKSTLVIDANWLPQTHTDNTTKGDLFWIKAMLAF
jgi:hypothetical protein